MRFTLKKKNKFLIKLHFSKIASVVPATPMLFFQCRVTLGPRQAFATVSQLDTAGAERGALGASVPSLTSTLPCRPELLCEVSGPAGPTQRPQGESPRGQGGEELQGRAWMPRAPPLSQLQPDLTATP